MTRRRTALPRLRVALVDGQSMRPAFHPGDLVVGVRPVSLRRGDVVLFHERSQNRYVIHRIVEVRGRDITTRGDNNPPAVTETVTPDRIEAKVVLRMPWIGRGILWMQKHLRGAGNENS